ncbi:glycerol-3-phosphate acyltransferase [Andreesenia angusta]|uniref:Glycerol-3-phosphate acyltransferase n=1 Tax=Andreesenia angusta TaxID=39480 RepID=A0A1S1V7P3_9FIRM|nr:glycerol-3-phosphate 1-O-acyltransferase PlsY [Andreesenia angusta]OHW62618.1 glycerol-3-phosphate acyltransferase [Andreesenia angusta]
MKSELLVAAIAYLLGNIQTSYLIGRYFKKTDIREHGSGNAGTTNALRVFGKKIAIITLLVDALKGVAAVYIGMNLGGLGLDGGLFAGIAVIVGHNWPFYLKFRGGKGVATSIGVGLAISPLSALISIAIGISIIAKSKYVSLGSIVAITIWPFLNILVRGSFEPKLFVFGIIMATMSIYKHRENIKRLANKTENRLGQKKS